MRRNLAGNAVKLKHVKIITKPNGRQFTYLAVPGCKLVRLPDGLMGAPEFLMAYAAAMAASSADGAGRPVANGSIAAAIIGYQRSTEFGNLAPSTAQQAIASQ